MSADDKIITKEQCCCGSTLLFVILAILAVGALAIGIQKISSVAVVNELMFNQTNQAKNLAYSGLEYAKGVVRYYEYLSKTQTVKDEDLVSYLNGTFDLGTGYGSFKLSTTKSSQTTAPVAYNLSVSSTGQTEAGPNQAKFQIPSTETLTFTPSTVAPSNPYEDFVIISNGNTTISGDAIIIGDLYVGSLTVSQATITGNVTSLGTTNLYYNQKIKGNLCSVGTVTMAQAATISGDLKSNSDVSLPNANTVGGTIYSDKTVSMDNQSRVGGDIDATGNITLNYGITVVGSAYTKGALAMGGGGTPWTSGAEPSAHGGTIMTNGYAGGELTMGYGNSIWGKGVTASTAPSGNGIYIGTPISNAAYPPPDTNQNVAPSGLPVSCTKYDNPKLTTFNPPTSPAGLTAPKKTFPTIGYKKDGGSIAPGWYGDATTGQYSTIKLLSGTYYFDSLTLGYGTKLYLDVTSGDILIFVNGVTTIDTRIDGKDDKYGGIYIIYKGEEYPFSSADISLAAKVYLECHSAIELTYLSNWFGTLFSSSTIQFDGANKIIGVYASLSSQAVSWSSSITYVQSNYAKNNW